MSSDDIPLFMQRSHIPLVRGEKVKKAHKPIPRVTKKRRGKNAEYARRRKAFLVAHPFCQVFIKEHQTHDESEAAVILRDGWLFVGRTHQMQCPKATEIHHTKKPKAKYLNDETTWLAVCREMHDKIESNKAWAREKGYLQNN